MSSPESQLEEAVCFAALNVPDAALRARFLERACTGDARLRLAVDEMLLAHADAERFFANGRAAVSAPEIDAQTAAAIRETNGGMLPDNFFTDEQIGSRVGRYKLLKKIGEGGCGIVYLAEQEEPVRRHVALKVIKLGMDTKSVIARFEAERQALAMMDHPNIARVLDAGATESGRPFFVMELVRGTRITKYCDEHQLATWKRLALFIQVCRAIQHAHQKGVIHRDIKPSNILVSLHDSVPVPKVIDFGIAKATEGRLTDQTLVTEMDHFVGTPAYMSPEQADISGLDVDTRSDIYSLGVLLYELLTGRTPFDTKVLMESGLDEMRRTLREQEPQLPSTMITSLRHTELAITAGQRQAEPPKLISQLQGDLDWIVMKALEKDRNRRYDTANGLAMDVQRYLDSEPVLARPPSQIYRLSKLVRRNRVVFVAVGAVAVTLLLGLGLSTWLFLRERVAREHEARLRAEAEDRVKVTQVVMFVSQGKYEEADQLLSQIKASLAYPTLDRVSALRSVGEWLALQGRWPAAADRFMALLKIDKLDRSAQIPFDYQACSVSLAQGGDPTQFGSFWQMAVTNYADKPNASILISCILLPLDSSQITTLQPMVNALEAQLSAAARSRLNEWDLMPFCLWQYRCGNYHPSIDWCQRALTQTQKFQSCDAAIHLVLAMDYYQVGRTNEAADQLAEGRHIVEAKFKAGLDHGRSGAGFWFDWIYDRLLLQEALSLTGGNPAASDSE
jgi:serine/threonine protein kinase